MFMLTAMEVLFHSFSSFHGLMSKAGMFSQSVKDDFDTNWKGLSGTLLIPVLSQMMRESEVCFSDSL